MLLGQLFKTNHPVFLKIRYGLACQMWPGTACTSWHWIPVPLPIGKSHLSLASVQVTNLGAVPCHQGAFTEHLLLKHGWGTGIAGKFLNLHNWDFAIPLSTHFIGRAPLVYRLGSIKSRQVYCHAFLTTGCSGGAVLNASWLLWLCLSSAEQNAVLMFWCLKEPHRPPVQ